MPLSSAGRKLKKIFRQEYGRTTGDKIFYSKENADESFSNKVTKSELEIIPDSWNWYVERLRRSPQLFDDEGIELLDHPIYETEIICTMKGDRPIYSFGFQGLPIFIESPRGTYRHWKDHNGKAGKTLMRWDYGFIGRSEAADGDHVDCYIGPNLDSKTVYVVRQLIPETQAYDEDKAMIGWDSEASAKQAYLDHYNDDRFYGGMKTYDIEEFREKVHHTYSNPGMIKNNL